MPVALVRRHPKAVSPPRKRRQKRQQRFQAGSKFVLIGPSRLTTRASYVDSFVSSGTRLLVFRMDRRGMP